MLLATPDNPRIRMLLTVAEGHYRIIGRKSAGINALADLRGKRITTALQTSAHYYLFKLLNSAGVAESDVTLVNVERTEMAQAIARRNADAISMWEPEAQKALDSLRTATPASSKTCRSIASGSACTPRLTSSTTRPGGATLVDFVRALLTASETVADRPQEAIPIVARAIGADRSHRPERVGTSRVPGHVAGADDRRPDRRRSGWPRFSSGRPAPGRNSRRSSIPAC